MKNYLQGIALFIIMTPFAFAMAELDKFCYYTGFGQASATVFIMSLGTACILSYYYFLKNRH